MKVLLQIDVLYFLLSSHNHYSKPKLITIQVFIVLFKIKIYLTINKICFIQLKKLSHFVFSNNFPYKIKKLYFFPILVVAFYNFKMANDKNILKQVHSPWPKSQATFIKALFMWLYEAANDYSQNLYANHWFLNLILHRIKALFKCFKIPFSIL